MPAERVPLTRRWTRRWTRSFWRLPLICATLLGVALAGVPNETLLLGQSAEPSQSPAAETTRSASRPQPADMAAPLPKGSKLILTNGTFQIIREYQRDGDRVRYYSLERSAWEEMPAAMVDWDATEKAEVARVAQEKDVLAKIKASDQAILRAEVESDASYEPRPGLLLPDKAGLYALAGTQLLPLEQNLAVSHISKLRTFERVASGTNIISQKFFVDIPGKHAKVRIRDSNLEFYFRPVDGREPRIELLRTDIQGDKRKLTVMSTNIAGQNSYKNDEVPLSADEAARGLYRFTVDRKLAPGEYALVEKTREGEVDLYVWDFGLDVPSGKSGSPAKGAK